MVIRIVLAGESQCQLFAEVCLVADYLNHHLPNFCYESIEKPVLDWKAWLCKINMQNNWHHESSPLVWKELIINGSKPYYIGGVSEFLEYCHSYYNLDIFMSSKVFGDLTKNLSQYRKKLRQKSENLIKPKTKKATVIAINEPLPKNDYTVCIYGAAHPLAMHLISGLLELSQKGKYISKIYIYDDHRCAPKFMEKVETECSFIGTDQPGKVVKYVDKIGIALTNSDILIVLRHIPFEESMALGTWLHQNEEIMLDLAHKINVSASRKMYILFANLGPACYNATVLLKSVTANQKNIAVATSGLGLEILSEVSEIAEVPIRNIFCPPVWGFVGINHIVDIRTVLHKYNSFEPYDRYTKVKNSTLNIGSVTPEIRTMEYLMHFDETIWRKISEKQKNLPKDVTFSHAVAVLNIVKFWLFDPNPDVIVNLGIQCDGSFGLTFEGVFSQPCRLKNSRWQPASEYMLPKDAQIKLNYLEGIAKMLMTIGKYDLPPITPFKPCYCKTKWHKRKEVW